MQVTRQIGSQQLIVETNEPCGIFLEESAAQLLGGTEGQVTASKKEVLSLLSNGDQYYPLSLYWELLDKCNFACPFCYIAGHSSQPIVRFAEARPYLVQLINEGLLFCVLTGGEVTIHPDFCRIYQFLKESGVVVDVYTNGFGITDQICDLFMRYQPHTIEISIYSLSNERMRDIYKAPGTHAADVVLNNVLRLKKLGLAVICKTFVNRLTVQELDAVIDWCAANEIGHYSSSEFSAAYDAEDISRFSSEGHVPAPCTKRERSICFPCGTKNYGCAVTAAFEISPCRLIRHRECYFDIRKLGVHGCLQQMKSFIRQFGDVEIAGGRAGTSGKGSCIAFSKPVRDVEGRIISFVAGD